jgi:hypothetical protein
MFSADPFAFGQQILNPTLRSLSLSLLKVHGSTFGQRWERLPILLFQLAAVFAESLIGYSSDVYLLEHIAMYLLAGRH